MNDSSEFDEQHHLDAREDALRYFIRLQVHRKFGEVDPQLLARIEALPAAMLDEALVRAFSVDSVEELIEQTRYRALDDIDLIIQERYTNKGFFDGRPCAFRVGFIEGFRAGYIEAALQSLRTILRSQMHKKFGEVDPHFLARIDELSAETLDEALGRLLTADSVEAVLGE